MTKRPSVGSESRKRTLRSDAVLTATVRRTVSSLDPTLPVANFRTMDAVFAEAVSRPRFIAQLLGIFAAVALALAATGVVVGLLGALAVTRLASSLLFGIKPADPVTFAGVAAFMLLVALIACLLPARRATRVDPLVALRAE